MLSFAIIMLIITFCGQTAMYNYITNGNPIVFEKHPFTIFPIIVFVLSSGAFAFIAYAVTGIVTR